MHQEKLFIPILLGTVRQGRASENVAKLIYERVKAHQEIETKLFDPKDMDLPMNDEGQELKVKNPDYRDAIIKSDGLIIVTPEYNHGYPGSLKRALDILLREYAHKAVGICGVSSGGFGGVRAVEMLLNVVRELGLTAISTDLYFPKAGELFDKDGELLDESYNDRIDDFLEELIWMAKALRYGRNNISSKFNH
ncbi:MAG: NADPH-dependent FMN reductase [bacterium]|nr:NADPH-dependent FMN reductase [bacterium]